jgi:uncharacterized repeat protein (TIGR02543 family)
MAAPSGTVWGNIVSGSGSSPKGRLGIYTNVTNTSAKTTVVTEVWFWTMYSCSDIYNNLYYNAGKGVTSASTDYGSCNIKHTVDTGAGWSTSNQTRVLQTENTYDRSTSAVTHNVYAKLSGIDILNGTVYANTSYTIPALPSYTVSYNANGGSGAPSSQTKWYGKSLTLSSTKPTRTGYSFKGWALSKEAADEGTWYYQPGSTCGANNNLTLYAVWEVNTYDVKYNANGGSGAPGDQTKTYGVTLTLSSTKPTRTNYTFKGWGTSASATTVAYQAGGSYTANTGITLYAIWVLAYTKPRITNFSVKRCTSDGTLDDSGTYARVAFDWACDRSVTSIKIEWKRSSASTWSSETVPGSGTSGSTVRTVNLGDQSAEYTYDIRVTVSDGSGDDYTTPKTGTLEGTKFVIDLKAGGDGIAFGKPAETSNVLDSAWSIKEQGELLSDKYSRKVDLYKKYSGNIQEDYHTTVIGLCSTSPTNTSIDSYSVGRIIFHRINGLNNSVMVDVAMEGAYGAAYGINVSLRQLGWHTEYVPVPVTFTYNGVTYGGLKVRYADAALKHVEFHGASNFDIFAVDYYNSNSGSVLNSEIYNSIVEVTHTGRDWSRLLYVSTYLQTPNVRATGNYGMHMGVANNPELAWLYQAGGSTDGSKWFSPKTDAGLLLGASNYRWGQIYSTTSSISTSDRNQKKDFAEFDPRYEELFAKLKPQLFKFNDGTSDRKHSGFISQDVEEAMLEVGLTAKDFAGFCKDVKQIKTGEDEETGEVFFENVCDENGDPVYNYSLRYEEFIALNTYIIQKQQSEIEALKNELQELKNLCSKILPQSEGSENGGNNQ